jgi:MFS family permease
MLSTTMRKYTGSTSAWYTLVANQPSPFIFRGIGLNGNTISLLATGVVGIVEFLFTIPAVLWVDKFGRKKILIAGAIGMASCHLSSRELLAPLTTTGLPTGPVDGLLCLPLDLRDQLCLLMG